MRLTRSSPESIKRAAARQHPNEFARAMNGGNAPSPFQRVVNDQLERAGSVEHATRKRPRRHDEDDLQRATCRLFDTKFAHRCFAFHVPNGGRRGKIEAARLVGMGVRAGVADWIVLLPGGKFAAIELKRADGGYLSGFQKAFRDRVEGLGGAWYLVRTIEEFDEAMTELLKGESK